MQNYPNVPPLMELETTGGGVARFNPNLCTWALHFLLAAHSLYCGCSPLVGNAPCLCRAARRLLLFHNAHRCRGVQQLADPTLDVLHADSISPAGGPVSADGSCAARTCLHCRCWCAFGPGAVLLRRAGCHLHLELRVLSSGSVPHQTFHPGMHLSQHCGRFSKMRKLCLPGWLALCLAEQVFWP